MNKTGLAIAISLLMLAGCSAPAPAAPATPTSAPPTTAPVPSAAAATKPGVTITLPVVPPLAPVKLTGATTAVVVNDVNTQLCKPQPKCADGMVPKIVSLLATARKAGALVIFTSANGAPVMPEVAPVGSEQTFSSTAQDRFYDTDLNNVLKSKGIKTLIVVGWRYNGSVLYTAVGAGLRNYTVVVPDDTTSAAQEYDSAVGRYQLLTQLNSNPNNEPLKANAVTLSRTDMITFQ